MPYLKDKLLRTFLDMMLNTGADKLIIPGALNYFIFRLAKLSCYNYKQYRNFIGELEMVKQEIYRRQCIPYENQKIKENGDVE